MVLRSCEKISLYGSSSFKLNISPPFFKIKKTYYAWNSVTIPRLPCSCVWFVLYAAAMKYDSAENTHLGTWPQTSAQVSAGTRSEQKNSEKRSNFVTKRRNKCKFLNRYSDWREGRVLFTLSVSFRIINTNKNLGIGKKSIFLEEITLECAANLTNIITLCFGGKGD